MGSLFGGAPKVDSTAPADLEDEKKKGKKARRNQFLTEGKVTGGELQPNQVQGGRNTFGN